VVAHASPPAKRWDEATRDVTPLLQDRTCIVIVGEQDEDAAHVALALAQTHVHTRRVAIVDAVGELAPLQKLLPRDARPHGVIDHFVHGVSLSKIAHAVNREGTMFILPSGVGPFEYDTLLRRERWRRLTMAFRGEGALLCIILPAKAAGLVGFVEDTDGIVLVGNVEYPEARHVIANVARVARVSADASVVSPGSTPRPGLLPRVTRQAPARRTAILAASLVALVAAGAVFAWARTDDGDKGPGASATVSAGLPAEAQRAGMIAAAERDSSNAALYSVDVLMLNSLAAAGRHLTNELGEVPAATFAPVHLGADSARWYRVLVGAWQERRQADSALLALRAAGVLEMGFGSVRRTPYAVRVGDDVSLAVAKARAMELRTRGFPAYVLERDEDHAGVYAGAFETPSQGVALLDMFKRAGIDATVGYRIGRGI
jgi:hypothetical protein